MANLAQEHPIYKLAAEISHNDEEILKDISACICETKKYFKEHREYEWRGMENFDDYEESEVRWIGMVDVLFEGNYVYECDYKYKEELEDFLIQLGGLNGSFYILERRNGRRYNTLPLEEDWFDEEDDISTWCAIIDEKWAEYQMCVGGIDIGRDSYVIFPCALDSLAKLQKYAEQSGYSIDYARNL